MHFENDGEGLLGQAPLDAVAAEVGTDTPLEVPFHEGQPGKLILVALHIHE